MSVWLGMLPSYSNTNLGVTVMVFFMGVFKVHNQLTLREVILDNLGGLILQFKGLKHRARLP